MKTSIDDGFWLLYLKVIQAKYLYSFICDIKVHGKFDRNFYIMMIDQISNKTQIDVANYVWNLYQNVDEIIMDVVIFAFEASIIKKLTNYYNWNLIFLFSYV